jgi:hypothetical protein
VRAPPIQFRRITAIQWLCAAVDRLLRLTELGAVPVLLSGYGSVLDHASAAGFARVAFSLRQMGLTLSSEASLRKAIYDFQEWETAKREESDFVEFPYAIDPHAPGIPFRRRMPGHDPRIQEWTDALVAGLDVARHGMTAADITRPFAAASSKGSNPRSMRFDLRSIVGAIAPAPQHDLSKAPKGSTRVPLGALEAIAGEFDQMDAADPKRAPGHWKRRLLNEAGPTVELLEPASDRSGLIPAHEIVLDGVKHLIGLPGTGKTTLIILLLAWLHREGLKTVVLLPSVEVSFNFLTTLSHYGVPAGLLMGQSPPARLDHAERLAERIASLDDARGFGRSVPFADVMGLTCTLAGFDEDDGEMPFPHLDPPCRDIKQKGTNSKGEERGAPVTRLCPLASWCGRMKSARDLARTHIWLGHVLSLDTRIPPHFTEMHIRHLEAVARTADVVIADEVDGIQATLDQKAVSIIDITGSDASYEMKLIEDLFAPVASGRNDMTASNVLDYSNKASRFIALNRLLTGQLQKDHRGDRFLAKYGDAFVTGNRVAFDLFGLDREGMTLAERADAERRFNAIAEFWDACVRDALFRAVNIDGLGERRDFDATRTAVAVGRTTAAVDDAYAKILVMIGEWLAAESSVIRDEAIEELREVVFNLIAPRAELDRPNAVALFRFLVHVTTVVMQFLALVPAQHAMVAEGVHRSPVFQQGISEDFKRLVPEALIGRLSGVRFRFEIDADRRTNLSVQYMTFEGAPRTLLYRLHELLRHDGREKGPAVLLSSATSFLEPSPTYHVHCGPHYVLRRSQAEDGWRDSVYLFQPIADPTRVGKMLRFSGAPYGAREKILRQMFDHYLQGDEPRLKRLLDTFAPGRKVAFVVNGYEQVALLKSHAMSLREHLGRRIVAVAKSIPAGAQGDYITTSQVERLGQREDWDAVIFPMKALSRGVNIVFGGDVFHGSPLMGQAAVGTVVFLTRPHPATESYDFVAGVVGADSLAFEQRRFSPGDQLSDLSDAWRKSRQQALRKARFLLRHSVQASRLGDLLEPFVADIMIDVLQTIGRSMRNGCKTRVIFADAAWAQRSADPNSYDADTPHTSFIVGMRDILVRCLRSDDAVTRAVYDALYRPFLTPLERCEGVRFHTAET